jgi:hypothetical protein
MQPQPTEDSRLKRPLVAYGLDAETRMREVLKEVHALLESYAPAWYTEALSKKIEAALKDRPPAGKQSDPDQSLD